MNGRRLKLSIFAGAVVAFAGSVALAPAAGAASGANGFTRQISVAAVTSPSSAAPSAASVDGVQSPELGPTASGDGATAANRATVNRSHSSKHAGALPAGPSVTTSTVSTAAATLVTSFDGLNHRQQRLANGGNQFSVEPPDQGLCAGNGVIAEFVNSVMRVYNPDGTPVNAMHVLDLNTFFGYPAQFNRMTMPRVVGPLVTDPSCYFDSDTNRWFADVLTLDTFSNGDLTGTNHIDLAVSESGDPTGSWSIFRLPVQDDGTQDTPNHGCTGLNPPLFGNASNPPTNPNACLGDYPHIGADANGIYITTNEYSLFGNDFHGAQIYAFSKSALAANNKRVNVTQFDTHGLDNGNSGFTLWPSIGANDINSSANNGTEFFFSSNAADEAHGNGSTVGPRQSNQLLVWSLTNTSSLHGNNPQATLSHVVLSVGQYAVPLRSVQEVGSTPLIDCLNFTPCARFLNGKPDKFKESEYKLDSNDTRMQQVMLSDGMLWGALDTSVSTLSGTEAGIEWFIVNPSASGGPSLANSGYLAAQNGNVIYPAVGVTSAGTGVIAFTLVGPSNFPSSAFAAINASGVGGIQTAKDGLGPADGFTGTFFYSAPNPPRPRWGDYGAAVVVGNNVWIASEYIGQTCTLAEYESTPFGSCGGTRTVLANWDTRISEVTPS
jgi:hypothetical protein